MKKMFLASSFCDVADLLEEFVGEKLEAKTVTFIPTASLVEEYKGHVENDKNAFYRLGMRVDVLELSTASPEEINRKLKHNDYIFVSGGNSFFLLEQLHQSGAGALIQSEIAKGKVYIGTSAGSIIMAPDITYIETMDDKSKAPLLQDYTGLHLIDQYPLVHYQDFPFVEVGEQVYQNYKDKLPLLLLNNQQVLLVDEDKIQIKTK